jgi:aspartyl-tRNA(Asn)/glutamyl-tRNA(Gln) amidotransferase subunit A
MADLNYLSIKEAHELLKSKQVSAVELTQFYLDKIAKLDHKIKAVLTVTKDDSLAKAKMVDDKIQKGLDIGVLEGIPYTAKDMFLTKGVRTTAASKILDNYIPPYNATVIQKLDEAGAIMIAKVNQDEFAHGGSTENSAYGPTLNPWDESRVPGGSSGGSAVAVAADFGIFSLGTDTGGSIRQPAAFCGVTGFKPSYGAVSRFGVVAMASSFDCIGPIARSAEDAQIVHDAISGLDPKDSTTVEYANPKEVEFKNAIYYPGDLEMDSLIDSIDIDNFKIEKAKGIDELEHSNLAVPAYYVLVPSEISSNLERYDGIRYGSSAKDAQNLADTYFKTRGEYLGPEVKRRNMIGTYALSAGYYEAYYKKAMQVRTLIINSINDVLNKHDVIMMPTTLEPAFKIGAKSDPVAMYKTDLLTVFANLAGLPAVSIPFGQDEKTGLPMGLQIIGKQGEDMKVLALAEKIQSGSDWHIKVKELKI